MIDIYEDLIQIAETERDVMLSTMTTLRIGGKVSYVVYPDSDLALDTLLRYLHRTEVPYKLIGKGSDLLCSDNDYEGVVIRLDRHMNQSIFLNESVIVQAGTSLIALAVLAMQKGLSGLEFASGIPGTIGGALFMNAGAYKSSMADVVDSVLVYKDGSFVWMDVEECGFGYRQSIFQQHADWIILAARIHLTAKNSDEISALMNDRRQRRLQSQPLEYPSCGSVFRNPEGYNAWQMVEGIGYRGKSIGGAEVSTKHCNFIVNKNNATAREYLDLVEEIQAKVKEKYGIELHTEMEKFNW